MATEASFRYPSTKITHISCLQLLGTCEEVSEDRQAIMAIQEKEELAALVGMSVFGMEKGLARSRLLVLMWTREEHTDNRYRCTENCVGARTAALTLPDRQDTTMSDRCRYVRKTFY